MGTIMCAGCSSIEDPSLEIVLTLDKEDEAISKIVLLSTTSRLNDHYFQESMLHTREQISF